MKKFIVLLFLIWQPVLGNAPELNPGLPVDIDLVDRLSPQDCKSLLLGLSKMGTPVPIEVVLPFYKEAIALRLRGKIISLLSAGGYDRGTLTLELPREHAKPGLIFGSGAISGSNYNLYAELAYKVDSEGRPANWVLQLKDFNYSNVRLQIVLSQRFLSGGIVDATYPDGIQVILKEK